MKRLLNTLGLISIASIPVSAVAQSPYQWTISDSSTDPYVNTDDTIGFHSVYLWLACTNHPNSPLEDGMSAAEFALVISPPGANSHIASNVQNGFLNAGSHTNLLLAVGGCPGGPVVAMNLLVIISVPGDIRLAPSSTQTKGTVDCSQSPALWPIDWIGLGFNTPAPGKGNAICEPDDSVEESTWGSIKGLYR